MTRPSRRGGLRSEMAVQGPHHDRDVTSGGPPATASSDLIGVRLTLYLGIAILAVLAAFFFIGPVTGIVVLLVAIALGIMAGIAAIRRADVTD